MTKPSIKVLTYNIHKGFSTSNLRFILHDIKDSLRHVDADVVFLQEIQGERTISKHRFDDWPNNNQFEFLADQVWQHHAYGKNAIYKSGHHGNAILSKYPFIEWENIDVSIMRSASRSLLHGTIQIPGIEQKIHIICVHLGLFERERESQLATLAKRIGSHVPADESLVIAGDFNDWRGRAERHLHLDLGVQEVLKLLTVRTHVPSLLRYRYYRWTVFITADLISSAADVCMASPGAVCLITHRYLPNSDYGNLP